ncbi:MAG: cysteine peptidase family C39 domain-containing protein, partial [Planctomycetota bacterium]
MSYIAGLIGEEKLRELVEKITGKKYGDEVNLNDILEDIAEFLAQEENGYDSNYDYNKDGEVDGNDVWAYLGEVGIIDVLEGLGLTKDDLADLKATDTKDLFGKLAGLIGSKMLVRNIINAYDSSKTVWEYLVGLVGDEEKLVKIFGSLGLDNAKDILNTKSLNGENLWDFLKTKTGKNDAELYKELGKAVESNVNGYGRTPSIWSILLEVVGDENKDNLIGFILAKYGFNKETLLAIMSYSGLDFSITSDLIKDWLREFSGENVDLINLLQNVNFSDYASWLDNNPDKTFWDYILEKTGKTEEELKAMGLKESDVNAKFIYEYLKSEFSLTDDDMRDLGLTEERLAGWQGDGNESLWDYLVDRVSLSGIFLDFDPDTHGSVWDYLKSKGIDLSEAGIEALTKDAVDNTYNKYYDASGITKTPWEFLSNLLGGENILEEILSNCGIDPVKYKNYINGFEYREILVKWGFRYNPDTQRFDVSPSVPTPIALIGWTPNPPTDLTARDNTQDGYAFPGASQQSNVQQMLDNIYEMLADFINASPDERQGILDSLGLGGLTPFIQVLDAASLTQIIDWLKGLGDKVINCAINALRTIGMSGTALEIAEKAIIIDILTGVLTSTKAKGDQLFLSMFAVQEAAESEGISLTGYGNCSINDLENALSYGPVIVHFGNNHFVVVTGLTDTHVTYLDNGRETTVTKGEFLQSFSGNLLSSGRIEGIKGLTENEMMNIVGGLTYFGVQASLDPFATYSNINSSYAGTDFDLMGADGWIPMAHYQVWFVRDENGNIIGQNTAIYEFIPGYGEIMVSYEETVFIWQDDIVGGIVIGSIVTTYESIVGDGAEPILVLTGRKVSRDVFEDGQPFSRRLYTEITYSMWMGSPDGTNGQFFEMNIQKIYSDIDAEKGRHQIIENYQAIPDSDPLYLNTQIIWTSAEDIDNDGIKEKINNVETYELGTGANDPGIFSSLQKTWKDVLEIDGMNRIVTAALTYEIQNSDIASYKSITYKEYSSEHGIETVTMIYDVPSVDIVTSLVRSFKVIDSSNPNSPPVTIAMNYISVGGTMLLETIQKIYDLEVNTQDAGRRFVKVTETYLDLNNNLSLDEKDDYLDSKLYTYWDRIENSRGETVVAQVTETILNLAGRDITESIKYNYKEEKLLSSGQKAIARVTETIEGLLEQDNARIVSSIQKTYAILQAGDNTITRVIEFYSPELLDLAIATQYIKKTIDTREGKEVLLTVIETMEFGLQEPVSIEKIWNEFNGYRIITHTATYELNVLVSEQLIWKEIQNINGVLRAVTYTETREFGLEGPTVLQKTYKHLENNRVIQIIENYEVQLSSTEPISSQKIYYDRLKVSDGTVRLVRVIENYEYGIKDPTLIQHIYYDERQTDEGTLRGVQVVENVIKLGDMSFVESVQYIYHKLEDVITDLGNHELLSQRLILVTEILEGDFSAGLDSGRLFREAFVVQIQKSYSIVNNNRLKRATLYFEQGLDLPISIQVSYRELEEREEDIGVIITDYYDYGVSDSYSQQKQWKKIVDQKIVTQTEYYELGILIYIQHGWRDIESINGRETSVSYKATYEGNLSAGLSNAIKTVQKTWREVSNVRHPVTGEDLGEKIITRIENYEFGTKTSEVYIWRHKESVRSANDRLVTYVVTCEFGMKEPISVQKSYYDKLDDYVTDDGGSRSPKIVRVSEEYEYATSVPASIKYVYYDERTINDGTKRIVQVVENRVPFGGVDFIESIQYVYRELKDSIYTKDGEVHERRLVTIIESYEGQITSGGDMSNAFLIGMQWEYSVSDAGRLKTVTSYFEPGIDEPLSVQYRYKETDTRAGKRMLVTIMDTYKSNIHTQTQKTWKDFEKVFDPIDGRSRASRVVSYMENYELGMLISVERSWKYFDASLNKIISYTEVYEGNIETGDIHGDYLTNPANTGITRTIVQKFYKDIYKGQLATIIESYEFSLDSPTSIQKVYYKSVDTELGGSRIAKVIENWLQVSDTEYQQSMQYIYRMQDSVVVDPETNETDIRVVNIIETYEGDFTISDGSFLSQIQKDYAIEYRDKIVRVSGYYDPSLPDTPTSIQFRYKRYNVDQGRLETVIDIYESGVNTLTQIIWKEIRDKLITHIENWEMDVLTSTQESWKREEILDNQEVVVVYTATYAFGEPDIKTVEKTYYMV